MTIAQQKIAAADARAAELGLDRHALPNAAGVHPKTWKRWRAGQGAPDLSEWARVEALLGITANRARSRSWLQRFIEWRRAEQEAA